MKKGMIECSVCHSKLVSPTTRGVSRAYDRHKSRVSSKQRALNVLLVVGDCVLVGFQVIHYQLLLLLNFFIITPICLSPSIPQFVVITIMQLGILACHGLLASVLNLDSSHV